MPRLMPEGLYFGTAVGKATMDVMWSVKSGAPRSNVLACSRDGLGMILALRRTRDPVWRHSLRHGRTPCAGVFEALQWLTLPAPLQLA